MIKAQLIIDGKEADYFNSNDLGVKITKQAFDINNVGNVKGDFTRELTLPRTRVNDKLFSYIADLQQRDGFKNFNALPAKIIVDGNILISGNITIVSIDSKGYKAKLIGNNVSWATAIDKLSIRDLSMRTVRFSGIHTSAIAPYPNQVANTVGFWQIWNTQEGGAYDVQFPLVSYGNFPCPSTATAPFNPNAKAILEQYQFFNASNYPLPWSRLYPCAYLRPVIRAIFENQGYTIGGDFFSNNRLKNLLIPYTNSDEASPRWNWGIMGRIRCDWNFRAGNFTTHGFTPLATGNDGGVLGGGTWYTRFQIGTLVSSNVDTVLHTWNERYALRDTFTELPLATATTSPSYREHCYKVLASGRYRATYGFTSTGRNMVYGGGAGTLTKTAIMLVCRNSDSYDGENGLGLWAHPAVPLGTPNEFDPQVKAFQYFDATGAKVLVNFNLTAEFDALAGDVIDIIIGGNQVAGAPINPRYAIGATVPTQTIVSILIEPLFDDELNPAWNLPDIPQREFLSSVIKTFNLYMNVDEANKRVTLNTYDSNFYPSGSAIDWTEKANIDNISIAPVAAYKSLELKLLDDSNDFIQAEDTYETDVTVTAQSNYYNNTLQRNAFYTQTQNKAYMAGPTSLSELITLPTMSNKETAFATCQEIDEGTVAPSVNFETRLLKWYGLYTAVSTTAGTKLFVGIAAGVPASPFSSADTQAYYSNYPVGLGGHRVFPIAYFYPRVLTGLIPTITDDMIYTFADLTIGGVVKRGTYFDFFQTLLDKLQRGVMVQIDIMLLPIDIANLDFRRPVRIGNIHFLINTVDNFDPIKPQTTKVKLIKL
jgi:hypothetical protein